MKVIAFSLATLKGGGGMTRSSPCPPTAVRHASQLVIRSPRRAPDSEMHRVRVRSKVTAEDGTSIRINLNGGNIRFELSEK